MFITPGLQIAVEIKFLLDFTLYAIRIAHLTAFTIFPDQDDRTWDCEIKFKVCILLKTLIPALEMFHISNDRSFSILYLMFIVLILIYSAFAFVFLISKSMVMGLRCRDLIKKFPGMAHEILLQSTQTFHWSLS
jgi:hypothetical protein